MNRRDTLILGGALVVGLLVVGRRRAKPQRVANPHRPIRPRRRVKVTRAAPKRTAVAPTTRLDELLREHLAVDARPGTFYQVTASDTPETIARAALRTVGDATDKATLDYIYCFTSSTWNLKLYGGPSTSNRFPFRWKVPGFGQGLRAAFLPRNAPAVSLMGSGVLPYRTVHEKDSTHLDGAEGNAAYGLIWLPPVSREQLKLGVVTCAHRTWDDGSSTIDPNPELLLEMAEAA